MIGASGTILSYNLFSYCDNNPVTFVDYNGESPANIIGAIAGGVTGAALGYLLADVLKLKGLKKVALVAAATVGGAVLGAFLGPYIAKLTKALGSTIKTGAKTVVKSSVKTSACFVAGTLVKTSTGSVPIERIEEGDLVWAADPDTGEVALKEVVQTFVNRAEALVHVTVEGEEIICTNEHPFYSPVKGWTAACKLRAGDILVTVNGEYVVVEKVQHEILETPITVYNFEVEGFHTYYVGGTAVLVHNVCKPARITNVSKSNSSIWKKLSSAKNGLKKSGSGKNLKYYSWDHLHNEIEVFDKWGKHLGVIDPTTGDWIKAAVKGRFIKV